mmetsp:Transcript_16847/g.63906  ORF Transcript_16847/g.63906 Transcript_16847/m.63906 type:complete len:296 (+) Transcript_16847:1166-2053(+)
MERCRRGVRRAGAACGAGRRHCGALQREHRPCSGGELRGGAGPAPVARAGRGGQSHRDAGQRRCPRRLGHARCCQLRRALPRRSARVAPQRRPGPLVEGGPVRGPDAGRQAARREAALARAGAVRRPRVHARGARQPGPCPGDQHSRPRPVRGLRVPQLQRRGRGDAHFHGAERDQRRRRRRPVLADGTLHGHDCGAVQDAQLDADSVVAGQQLAARGGRQRHRLARGRRTELDPLERRQAVPPLPPPPARGRVRGHRRGGHCERQPRKACPPRRRPDRRHDLQRGLAPVPARAR